MDLSLAVSPTSSVSTCLDIRDSGGHSASSSSESKQHKLEFSIGFLSHLTGKDGVLPMKEKSVIPYGGKDITIIRGPLNYLHCLCPPNEQM